MGQKVDPRGMRIGITKSWDSRWFAEGKEYLNNFHEDIKIKELSILKIQKKWKLVLNILN